MASSRRKWHGRREGEVSVSGLLSSAWKHDEEVEGGRRARWKATVPNTTTPCREGWKDGWMEGRIDGGMESSQPARECSRGAPLPTANQPHHPRHHFSGPVSQEEKSNTRIQFTTANQPSSRPPGLIRSDQIRSTSPRRQSIPSYSSISPERNTPKRAHRAKTRLRRR